MEAAWLNKNKSHRSSNKASTDPEVIGTKVTITEEQSLIKNTTAYMTRQKDITTPYVMADFKNATIDDTLAEEKNGEAGEE